jgi:uncharacterized protein YyaL (SSP411 family)
MYETIFPSNWNLTRPAADNKAIKEILGYSLEELETRAKNCVYLFLDSLYDEKEGGLRHYYRADKKYYSELDSGNFLMAINYLTMFDLCRDTRMLDRAGHCFQWAYDHATETHPMFTWQGGVRDGFKPNELYVKYTGDAFLTCIALYRRTKKEEYLFYMKQFHNFFKQARKAGFKYKYDINTYQWSDKGFVWRSFGFPVTAYIELYEAANEKKYLEEAIQWGNHGLTLQADNGCFYLLDGEFWNSDLTAPEIRGLNFLYEITGEEKYLTAAVRYADWLIAHQNEDGSWPIGIDSEDEVSAPNIGPGDMPNIALAMIRLHMNTKEQRYFDAAIKAIRYSLSLQALEDGKYPLFLDDKSVKWGFWSWDPLHDVTLSGDQTVHHIRGILFMAYYIGSLMK